MVLGKVARSVKIEKPLVELIASKCWERRDVPPLSMDAYVRGSGFASLCLREEVLRVIHDITRVDNIETDLEVTFALGTGMHYALQNLLLPDCGVLYGRWKCVDCGQDHGGISSDKPLDETVIPRPAHCSICGSPRFYFDEFFFESQQYRINGHPDGFLKLPQYEGLGIFEAKSISGRKVINVKRAPQIDHVLQAHIYMWLTGLQWAQILYWDKSTFGIGAFVEHHVPRDEETIEEFKVSLSYLWECISMYLNDGVVQLPDRICSKADCPRALSCSAMLPCFKEPA